MLFFEIIYKRLLSTFCETSHTNGTFWKVQNRKYNLTSWCCIIFILQKLSFCFLVKENNGKNTYIVKKNLDFAVKWGCEIKQETNGDVNSTLWSGQFPWNKKIFLDFSAWLPWNSTTLTFIISNTCVFTYCTVLWVNWSTADLCQIKYVWKDYKL